jgi:hypothetical protein
MTRDDRLITVEIVDVPALQTAAPWPDFITPLAINSIADNLVRIILFILVIIQEVIQSLSFVVDTTNQFVPRIY